MSTIEADIIKQKLPTNNGGFQAIGFGKYRPEMYDQLTTDHPIDLTRLPGGQLPTWAGAG